MAIKNISIEWQRCMPGVCVTTLHPGTTNTELFAPFQRSVPEGKLFSTRYTAECLVTALSKLEPADNGKFFNYDGSELPW